jgi:hypothetical protein
MSVRNRRSRPRLVLPLLALAIVSVSGFGGGYYYTSRPTYALARLGAAVAAHDSATAFRYLDTKATASQVVESFTSSVSDQMMESKEGATGFGMLGQALAMTMMDKLKPMMAKRLEYEMRHAVSSPGAARAGSLTDIGSVPDAPGGGSGPAWMQQLAGSVASGGARTMNFAGFGATDVRGDSATVEVRLHHNDLDTTLVVRVAMARTTGTWRVVGVPNLPGVMSDISGTEALRLRVANAPIMERINRLVQVGEFRAHVRNLDQWGFSQQLVLEAAVRNTGTHPLTTVVLELVPRDSSVGSETHVLTIDVALPPRATGAATGAADYNRYDAAARRVLTSPERFRLAVRRVVTGGEEIAPFSSWTAYRSQYPAIAASR